MSVQTQPLHSKDVSQTDKRRDMYEVLVERLSCRTPRIYEAGGGSVSWLPTELLANSYIVVVDIDRRQLEHNRYAQARILGDIQEVAFPPGYQ